ncbi:hypothetical protein EV421DRAFT_1739394 [Armillaria borealis]|uniref:Uncharacterized protein n=1 Tax=Armillaria borealis TaxID=47425 RepID=A0AA39MJK1_9AGAR|nr:hypothetical protein EV421DRAFT_1739394 [Armillaria borealis]
MACDLYDLPISEEGLNVRPGLSSSKVHTHASSVTAIHVRRARRNTVQVLPQSKLASVKGRSVGGTVISIVIMNIIRERGKESPEVSKEVIGATRISVNKSTKAVCGGRPRRRGRV